MIQPIQRRMRGTPALAIVLAGLMSGCGVSTLDEDGGLEARDENGGDGGDGGDEASSDSGPRDSGVYSGKDAGASVTCGDRICGRTESCTTCPHDCGVCKPRCGDNICNGTETCTTCPHDCGVCPIPCPHEGGLFCGGDGVGGDPTILYLCHSGALQIKQRCGTHCQYMPLGIPDQCPSSTTVPTSLLATLASKPYVEYGSCHATTYPGWPYPAQACTYSTGGLTATVIVADPSADRVGRWVVDAASLVPALNALKGVHQAEYEQGLQKIAGAVISASSRIFPLSGGIIENQDGNGYVNYSFLNGVTTTCRSGCFCRVNSLYRLDWCEYAAASGKQAYSTCVNTVGTANYTTGWGAECLQNHARAWNSDVNEHFRARAYLANKRVVASRCPPGACTPAQVVSAVQVGFQ